jgi:hypothetical protein
MTCVNTKMSIHKIIAVAAVVALLLAMSYTSNASYGARVEREIQAIQQTKVSILVHYRMRVREVVQVPESHSAEFAEVLEHAISDWHEADGMRSAVKWIKDHGLQFTGAEYNHIRTCIELGQSDYRREEIRLAATVRAYRTNLGYVWSGFWLQVAGYPSIDLAKYELGLPVDLHIKSPRATKGEQ